MKKNVIPFKNYIFYCVFWFVLYILLIDTVDSDGLMVFLLSHCQMPKLHFLRLYKVLVSIGK